MFFTVLEHAERLNEMDTEEAEDAKDKFRPEDLEEIQSISVDIQYKELLNIMESKKDDFEDTISKYEQRINELKKKLNIVSVPSNPQQ